MLSRIPLPVALLMILVGVMIGGELFLSVLLFLALLGVMLWALTYILQGFFPWAYRERGLQGPDSGEFNADPANREPILPIRPNMPDGIIPSMNCPKCNTPMEFIASGAFYCWKDGEVVILDSPSEPQNRSGYDRDGAEWNMANGGLWRP